MKSKVAPITRFSEQELYDMWVNFKDNSDALAILSDFMVTTKTEAQIIINQFELRFESEMLNENNRGKANRVQKTV